MVAAVATDEPDTAANIAEAPMFVCSSPPGSGLSQSDSERYMRSVKPPRTSNSPSSTNSGIATSTKLLVAPQYCVPNCSVAGQPR